MGPVFSIADLRHNDGQQRQDAVENARLISAAPELLEALQAICANDIPEVIVQEMIEKAIAKATGQPKP
jgi:hypothetical protein